MATMFIPAILEGITSRSDKTIKLSFATQELSVGEAGTLFSFLQSMVYLGIKEELFSRQEEDAIQNLKADSAEYQSKTPSQRLRSVMFVSYQQSPEGYDTFTRYYEHKMEQLINHFKSKLEP